MNTLILATNLFDKMASDFGGILNIVLVVLGCLLGGGIVVLGGAAIITKLIVRQRENKENQKK